MPESLIKHGVSAVLSRFGLVSVLLLMFLPVGLHTESSTPLYLDPQQPVDVRVNDLMSRMTLKEKVGQLNLPCVYVDQLLSLIHI